MAYFLITFSLWATNDMFNWVQTRELKNNKKLSRDYFKQDQLFKPVITYICSRKDILFKNSNQLNSCKKIKKS